MARGRRAASAAGDDRSRRRLVDPEGAAELAPDRLGLRARGIAPEHDAVAVLRGPGAAPAGPFAASRTLHRDSAGPRWRATGVSVFDRAPPAVGLVSSRRLPVRTRFGAAARGCPPASMPCCGGSSLEATARR